MINPEETTETLLVGSFMRIVDDLCIYRHPLGKGYGGRSPTVWDPPLGFYHL
jgi:hypothetical protein